MPWAVRVECVEWADVCDVCEWDMVVMEVESEVESMKTKRRRRSQLLAVLMRFSFLLRCRNCDFIELITDL